MQCHGAPFRAPRSFRYPARVAVAVQPCVAEPIRRLCKCGAGVLVIVVGDVLVTASLWEWEPLHRCERCAFTRSAHPGKVISCHRCAGRGLVGERRPPGRMLAIDVGWGDDLNVRLIGPSTPRRRGEALYPLHVCGVIQSGGTRSSRRL